MTTSCVHAIDGRARIRIPGLKGSPTRVRDLEARVGMCAGVRYVKASPTTGNALIIYDEAAVSLDHIHGLIRDWLSQHGLDVPNAPAERASTSLRGKVVATVWTTATEIALRRLLFA